MALVLPTAKLPSPSAGTSAPHPPPLLPPPSPRPHAFLPPLPAWLPLNLSSLSRIFPKPQARHNHSEPLLHFREAPRPSTAFQGPQGQLSPCPLHQDSFPFLQTLHRQAASPFPPLPLCLSWLRTYHFLPTAFPATSSPVSCASSFVTRDVPVPPGLKPPEGRRVSSTGLAPGRPLIKVYPRALKAPSRTCDRKSQGK